MYKFALYSTKALNITLRTKEALISPNLAAGRA